MLDAALAYARKGRRVFPCEKKVPLIPTGFKAASSDETKIGEWWGEWPAAQIALPTGRVNGLFVLDVDGPAGAAIAAGWKLPETFAVETRPGRQQFWFRQADGVETKCSAGVLGEQLDTRGDGGYVIAPPSIHHETGLPYRIVKNLPLADPPSFLLEPKQNGAQPSNGVDAIPKGKRHQTMLSIAGALRARGLSGAMTLAQLELVNLRQCKPSLEDSELQKLADYVGTKLPGFRGQPMETSAAVDLESYSEVAAEKLQWLWHLRLPRGKLTIFSGDPGQGKSLATLDIAARISCGQAFPDGARSGIGDVILLSGEDDPADTIRPRLDLAGADVRRIHRIKRVTVTLADGSSGESAFSLARDIEKLGDAFARFPEARLFVVDPISAYMGTTDTWKDSDVRRILSPLADLAQRTGITTIGVMHPKKGDGSAMQRVVSGSVAFQAAARVVWGFADDPDCPGRHVMVSVKANLGPGGNGLAYRIEAVNDVPRIVWEKGVVNLTADAALGRSAHHEERSKVQETTQWLDELLASGPALVADVQREAKASGHSWRSVERAKQNLGVKATRPTVLGPWYWISRPPNLF